MGAPCYFGARLGFAARINKRSGIKIPAPVFKQLVQNAGGAHLEKIGEHIIQLEITHGQTVLSSVFLASS